MQTQGPFGTGTPVPPPEALAAAAREQVKLPAIFLILSGAFSVVVWAVQTYRFVPNRDAFRAGMESASRERPDAPEWILSALMLVVDAAPIIGGIAILASAVVIVAGIRMLSMRSYGLALAGSILALIPYITPCCCLGIPFGIWSLVILSKSEVKQAFAS